MDEVRRHRAVARPARRAALDRYPVRARRATANQYPFDGPGGTLAHTFYPAPPNPEPIAGDMHLDADEAGTPAPASTYSAWCCTKPGTRWALGHSDRPGSVMYPYYPPGLRIVRRRYRRRPRALRRCDHDFSRHTSRHEHAGHPALQSSCATPCSNLLPSRRRPPISRVPRCRSTRRRQTIVSTTSSSIPISGVAGDNVGVTSVKWVTSTGGSGTAPRC